MRQKLSFIKVLTMSILIFSMLISAFLGCKPAKKSGEITPTEKKPDTAVQALKDKDTEQQDSKDEPLGEEQKKVLKERMGANMLDSSSFDSYASYLYAVMQLSIGSRDSEVVKTELLNVFVRDYKPTVEEIFNAIARQTKTTYKYDSKNKEWLFSPVNVKKPYTLTLSQDWKETDMGLFLKYNPKIAPVGMDVYVLGTYSIENNSEAALKKILEEQAVNFAKPIKESVTLKDMKIVKVDGVDALYFETPAPREGITWRQWAVMKNNKMFVIVSSLNNNQADVLLPQVQDMVKSFKVSQ